MLNVNKETGIAYGVVALNSLHSDVIDEFYTCGINITLKAMEAEYREKYNLGENDEIPAEWYDDLYLEEESYELESEGMTLFLSHLGGAPLVFIYNSPHTAYARPCSPCIPGAGDLDNKDETGILCYDLPADWYYTQN